jgi:hypothetical protein
MKNFSHYKQSILEALGKKSAFKDYELSKEAFFMQSFQYPATGLQLGGSDVVPSIMLVHKDTGEIKFIDLNTLLPGWDSN